MVQRSAAPPRARSTARSGGARPPARGPAGRRSGRLRWCVGVCMAGWGTGAARPTRNGLAGRPRKRQSRFPDRRPPRPLAEFGRFLRCGAVHRGAQVRGTAAAPRARSRWCAGAPGAAASGAPGQRSDRAVSELLSGARQRADIDRRPAPPRPMAAMTAAAALTVTSEASRAGRRRRDRLFWSGPPTRRAELGVGGAQPGQLIADVPCPESGQHIGHGPQLCSGGRSSRPSRSAVRTVSSRAPAWVAAATTAPTPAPLDDPSSAGFPPATRQLRLGLRADLRAHGPVPTVRHTMTRRGASLARAHRSRPPDRPLRNQPSLGRPSLPVRPPGQPGEPESPSGAVLGRLLLTVITAHVWTL